MNRIFLNGAGLAGGLFVLTSTAFATPINVLNPSFESPTVVGNNGLYDPATPTSWTPSNFAGQYVERYDNGGFGTFPVSHQPGIDGNQYIADDFNSGATATLVQDLNVVFQPNTTYTVNLAGGKRGGFNGADVKFGLRSSTSPAANLGGAVLGFISENALADSTFVDANAAGANGGLFTFTTGDSVPTGDVLAFIEATSGLNNPRLHADNFRVDSSPAPEPATLGLMATAAVGVLARRRRPSSR